MWRLKVSIRRFGNTRVSRRLVKLSSPRKSLLVPVLALLVVPALPCAASGPLSKEAVLEILRNLDVPSVWQALLC